MSGFRNLSSNSSELDVALQVGIANLPQRMEFDVQLLTGVAALVPRRSR